MKAKVTMSMIWFNNGLRDLFFREQAYNTLEKLVTKSVYGYQTIEKLNDATEDMDIDDVEETFYSESVEYCADEFGIELEKDDDDYRETLQDVENYIQSKTMESLVSSHVNK